MKHRRKNPQRRVHHALINQSRSRHPLSGEARRFQRKLLQLFSNLIELPIATVNSGENRALDYAILNFEDTISDQFVGRRLLLKGNKIEVIHKNI